MNFAVHRNGLDANTIHHLRIIASFALLGAVIAGSVRIIPAIAGLPIDWHAIGAVAGAVSGTLVQLFTTE